MKICAAASEYIFHVSVNVWLLLGVFQCFLKNVRLLLKDINDCKSSKEKNVRLLFRNYVHLKNYFEVKTD